MTLDEPTSGDVQALQPLAEDLAENVGWVPVVVARLESLFDRHAAGENVWPELESLAASSEAESLLFIASLSADKRREFFEAFPQSGFDSLRKTWPTILVRARNLIGLAITRDNYDVDNTWTNIRIVVNYNPSRHRTRLNLTLTDSGRVLWQTRDDVGSLLRLCAAISRRCSDALEMMIEQGSPQAGAEGESLREARSRLAESPSTDALLAALDKVNAVSPATS